MKLDNRPQKQQLRTRLEPYGKTSKKTREHRVAKRPFRKPYLLGYVPSIDRLGDTIQIIRVTNGRGTLLTDDFAEVRRVYKGRNTGMKVRLFSAAFAAKPGMVPFVRLARSDGRLTRFAYFPRGDVAHIELRQQGWSEERVLGYVSTRQLLNTVPLFFLPATSAFTLAAIGQGVAFAATTADASDLQMRNPVEQIDPPGNAATEFLLVPKDVSARSLRVWVGKLDNAAPAEDRRLSFWDPSIRTKVDEIRLRAEDWKPAVNKEGFNCWYRELTVSNLSPGKHYSLVLINDSTGADDAYGEAATLPAALPTHVPLERWDVDGNLGPRRTLHVPDAASSPAAKAPADLASNTAFLSGEQSRPFKIFAGSCYSRQYDNGRVAQHYARLYGSIMSRPGLKLLLGNQVYLDAPYYRGLLSEMSGGYTRDKLAESFLNKYGSTWTELSGLLSLGANCFTTGDHEYWSGYPDDTLSLPQLFEPQRWADWEILSTALRDAFQTMRSTQTMEIGNDLSIFVFDTRRNRTKRDVTDPRFADAADLLALRNWILRLKGPGVIAGGPLLFDGPPGAESNLRSFPTQYSQLCQMLAATSHDLVYLAGDAHFGRIAQVQFPGGHKLIEVVTSPMSLVEDDGNYIWAATGTGSQYAKDVWVLGQDVDPGEWPQILVAGVGALPITYLEAVPANQEDSARTEENFMILSFAKKAQAAAVRMKVNCYLPRRQEKAFSKVFELS
ncbi:MAG: hypothetical protein OEP48_06220 [Betaproteobacteria bacterium]|nr:hypothetical protein [Betaproteobacteria bacterium]